VVPSFVENFDEFRMYSVQAALPAVAFELISFKPLAAVHFFLPFPSFAFLNLGFAYFIKNVLGHNCVESSWLFLYPLNSPERPARYMHQYVDTWDGQR
tara:strand:- start:183 stop:476 length:294 start_codon:yes stop_codon:yes gene_type:complete